MSVRDMAVRVGRWAREEGRLMVAGLKDPRTRAVLVTAGLAAVLVMAGTEPSWATTDANIEPAAVQISNYIQGSGGKVAAGVALATAIGGSVLRFNMHQVLGAIGVGLLATLGYPAVTAGFTALI